VLTASLIGVFIRFIPILDYRTLFYDADGVTRFSALTGNPNRLQFHVLLGLCSLFVLDLKHQIKPTLFYPLFIVLFALGFATVSRNFAWIVIVVMVVYAILKLRNEKSRGFKPLLLIAACIFVIAALIPNFTAAYLMRLLGGTGLTKTHFIITAGVTAAAILIGTWIYTAIKKTKARPVVIAVASALIVCAGLWMFANIQIHESVRSSASIEVTTNTYDNKHPDADIWSVVYDPGRPEIWRMNFEDWLSSPKKILFGRGFDTEIMVDGLPLIHEHNVFILILARTGIIGFLLFIGLWVVFFRSFSKAGNRLSLPPFIFILTAVCLGMFEMRFPQIFTFLFLFFFTMAPNEVLQKESKNT
jgi:O-antigen ligase